MKASEMIIELQRIIDEHGDLNLIYAEDDEGNGFHALYGSPCVGKFEDEEFQIFLEDDNSEDEDDEDDKDFYNACSKEEINAICIN